MAGKADAVEAKGALLKESWLGLEQKNGKYVRLSKDSVVTRWNPDRAPGEDDTNAWRTGTALGNAYFYVGVSGKNKTTFLGPGDVLVVAGGNKVLYLAVVTPKGVSPCLLVHSESDNVTKRVPVRDLSFLVRPSGDVDTERPQLLLREYVSQVAEEEMKGTDASCDGVLV